jgi:hypothetical protein
VPFQRSHHISVSANGLAKPICKSISCEIFEVGDLVRLLHLFFPRPTGKTVHMLLALVLLFTIPESLESAEASAASALPEVSAVCISLKERRHNMGSP